LSLFLSPPSLILMKVRDSDILVWVSEQRKVLGMFGMLDFTMLWLILTWCVVFILMNCFSI
jgi:uncharacterized BrkB/YihY/UPF0761 family membrane protein